MTIKNQNKKGDETMKKNNDFGTVLGEVTGIGIIYAAFLLIGQWFCRKWADDYEERH